MDESATNPCWAFLSPSFQPFTLSSLKAPGNAAKSGIHGGFKRRAWCTITIRPCPSGHMVQFRFDVIWSQARPPLIITGWFAVFPFLCRNAHTQQRTYGLAMGTRL